MTEILRPPAFQRRVLALEAPGARPASVSIVVPTITRPGEPFDVKVALADEKGYPSLAFGGSVTVRPEEPGAAAVDVAFAEGAPAVATVHGVTLAEEGLTRFSAELDGRTFFSNPTLCTAQPRRQIYWGDPHVHTVLSNCHPDKCRSVQFCFTAARWFAGLDWATAADHVSNGRCEPARWKEQAAASDAHDDPPEFVTLPGYEASLEGGRGGDTNVYMLRWPDVFVDEYERGSVKTLCERLSEKLEPAVEFFVVPHHTTRTGKHGEIPDEIYPGEQLMPVLEIHSKWGTSEYRGNPSPLHKIHPGPSYAVDLLGKGLRLGFIAGTDTHSTMPAGFGDDANQIDRLPGMTAVVARKLTREDIFGGIRDRNCYAASLERIFLDVSVAGARPGEKLKAANVPGTRKVAVTAAAQSDIVSIDVVRNGQTIHTTSVGEIHTTSVGDWKGSLEFEDAEDLAGLLMASRHLGKFAYYYVRVTCASGAQAWSSPVWIC
ncbi:MAG: hypothetical protein ACYTF6_12435 [Planctomycetota bacterium]|jgi:hypothetical protein